MLQLRFVLGGIALGALLGAVQCAIEAQTASDTVRATLESVFIIACAVALLFGAVAVCCDHRTAFERDLARRTRNELLRIKARKRLKRERSKEFNRTITRAW